MKNNMNETVINWLGAIGFIAICLLCIMLNTERIETDIHNRSRDALLDAKILTAAVSADGRDVLLSGYVANEDLKNEAGNLVDNLFGVRSVNNEIKILREAAKEKPMQLLPPEDERHKDLEALSKNILFEPDNARLFSSSYEALDRIAQLLIDNSDLAIEISGHTDTQGLEELNKELSLARADAVKNYLITRNVDAGRMTTAGFGSAYPIADNSTEEGRTANRRVEFKLSREE